MLIMRKILIVDDDEDDKDFLCEAIQNIDDSAYCIWVSDGLHALRLINDGSFNPPDYIFLDLNMPKIGGIQCRHCKGPDRNGSAQEPLFSRTIFTVKLG